jgi:hypothetical protein
MIRQRSRNDNEVESGAVNGHASAEGNIHDVNAPNSGSNEHGNIRNDDVQSQSDHGSQYGGTTSFTSSTFLPTRDRASASGDLTSTKQNDEGLQSTRDVMGDDQPTHDDDELSSDAADPQCAMERFRWDDLLFRYHEKMHDLQGQEDQILQEFNGLCDVLPPCRCDQRPQC